MHLHFSQPSPSPTEVATVMVTEMVDTLEETILKRSSEEADKGVPDLPDKEVPEVGNVEEDRDVEEVAVRAATSAVKIFLKAP